MTSFSLIILQIHLQLVQMQKLFFETAIGVGIGWKQVSDSGFLIDINGGIGRNLGLSDDANLGDITGRFGVNFGWQF